MQVARPNFQNPAQGVLRRRTNAWPCLFQIQRSPMVLPAVPWHPLRAPLAWDCAPRRPVATWQFPRDCAERLLVHGVPDDDLLHSARCQPPRMFGQPDQHHGSCVRGWSFGGEKQNCQRTLTLGPNLPAARFPGMPSVRWGRHTHAHVRCNTHAHVHKHNQEKQSFRAHVFRQHGNTHCNAVGRPTHR